MTPRKGRRKWPIYLPGCPCCQLAEGAVRYMGDGLCVHCWGQDPAEASTPRDALRLAWHRFRWAEVSKSLKHIHYNAKRGKESNLALAVIQQQGLPWLVQWLVEDKLAKTPSQAERMLTQWSFQFKTWDIPIRGQLWLAHLMGMEWERWRKEEAAEWARMGPAARVQLATIGLSSDLLQQQMEQTPPGRFRRATRPSEWTLMTVGPPESR